MTSRSDLVASAVDSQSVPSVLVIGAGPAGVTTALQLNAAGIACLLVERETFPRFKVCGCCLNLAALSALKTLELDHLLTSQVVQPLNLWELRVGNRIIRTTLPGGIAISRGLMDQLLLDEATRRGVQVRTACEAKILQVDSAGVEVELRSTHGIGVDSITSSTHRFEAVVVASGLLGGGVSKWLPYEQEPSGPWALRSLCLDYQALHRRRFTCFVHRLDTWGWCNWKTAGSNWPQH